MDNHKLIDLSLELGYLLAMNGAETYRIEESVSKVLDAYGARGEVFAIPNCIHVSIETADGIPLTRMRRIGSHGNNLDAMEVYSNLSRRICKERPDLETWAAWQEEAKTRPRSYNIWFQIIGGFLAACGYCVFFGGDPADALCAGVCGIAVCLINLLLTRLKVNPFFNTIVSAFLMAAIAYTANGLSLTQRVDTVIIGTLMILVPGLLFTNALRDIIYGDTNSGINRIVQVFLIAAAIALGTGAAWRFCASLWTIPTGAAPLDHKLWLDALACLVGGMGFVVVFNIHGKGGILCAVGGMVTWVTYLLIVQVSGHEYLAYFCATLVASLYSEIMARVRKFPATAYLVISAFPLLPGAGIFYTMRCAVSGDMQGVISQGVNTLAIAGIMAVGILITSTLFRILSQRQAQHIGKK